jgi:hypothetical protein
MLLKFSEKEKVKVEMIMYVEGLFANVTSDMCGMANTPAASHLLEINNKNPTLLEANKREMFHTLVAKLLYFAKRGRPDIMLAISFLCTRVRNPDIDDYRKLRRVVKYLRKTQNLVLTLECNNLHNIMWWVDASHAWHDDMRGQSGGMVSLGKGAIYVTSVKQKLNTRSSTEVELVAVYDVMPQMIWVRNFMIQNGIDVHNNILYQDNRSAMLLETNGKLSSSKRTRHINIRYFFVKDRIKKGEIKLEHCKLIDMLGDFFTKPLQGSLFIKDWNAIMNTEEEMNNAVEV